MGADLKAIARMKRMVELQDLMFTKHQARDGEGLMYPMRLLQDKIERRRTPKERERGWINDYKAGTQPTMPVQYMDEQLVLRRKILGREPDSPKTFLSSWNNYKRKHDVEMQGRERGWRNSTRKKDRENETLYGMTRPTLHSTLYSELQSHADSKLLHNKKLEHNRNLQRVWVSLGREQGRRKHSWGLGRPRGHTSAELQSLAARAEKQERKRTTRGIPEKFPATDRQQSSGTRFNVEGQPHSRRQKYHTRLVVPIGTLERSGFGSASYRTSITPEGQRDKYNQLLETGWVHRYDAGQGHWQHGGEHRREKSDEDILKQGIEKEEVEGWMSSYRRNRKKELFRLAKQNDKTASEVLRENYNKYREGGWINPLQRQKRSIHGLGSNHKAGRTGSV